MSVYEILDSIQSNGLKGYVAKMMHEVPKFDVVKSREDFLIEQAEGKVILDLGYAANDLFKRLSVSALRAYGLDKDASAYPTTEVIDFGELHRDHDLPFADKGIELVIAAELLEHLSNPGLLLDAVKWTFPDVTLIVTVPNCFAHTAIKAMQAGTEFVNEDHVCWYSWWTLRTLLERSSYRVTEWHWYNGEPLWAEGLIAVCHGDINNGRAEKESTE